MAIGLTVDFLSDTADVRRRSTSCTYEREQHADLPNCIQTQGLQFCLQRCVLYDVPHILIWTYRNVNCSSARYNTSTLPTKPYFLNTSTELLSAGYLELRTSANGVEPKK
jgi:hypothetical protein